MLLSRNFIVVLLFSIGNDGRTDLLYVAKRVSLAHHWQHHWHLRRTRRRDSNIANDHWSIQPQTTRTTSPHGIAFNTLSTARLLRRPASSLSHCHVATEPWLASCESLSFRRARSQPLIKLTVLSAFCHALFPPLTNCCRHRHQAVQTKTVCLLCIACFAH